MRLVVRKSLWCVIGSGGLLVMAVLARQVTRWSLPFVSARVIMLVFILLCPVLLGMAIGVWGGERGRLWGARGVSGSYLGVVGWAWMQDGVFPVGFQLPGVPVPFFVTLINLVIFLITWYFMQALGGSGGRLGSSLAGSSLPASNDFHPLPAPSSHTAGGSDPT
ncbi:MAG: hypothetical protein HY207_06245 [Nitrospirae bacterium]|nr:hypothetical protein [Nitrospirota bacterium]